MRWKRGGIDLGFFAELRTRFRAPFERREVGACETFN